MSIPQLTLVSTITQGKGFGRRGNSWIQCNNSLALSFYFPFSLQPSLGPLKIGLDIQTFIHNKFGITTQLKWPNDIFYNGCKVGGVICQLINGPSQNWIIAGIGLNLGKPLDSEILTLKNMQAYYLLADDFSQSQIHNYCSSLFEHSLATDYSESELISKWEKSCFHLGKMVEIYENDKLIHTGLFKGIGNSGQAILFVENQNKEIWSGTLRVVENKYN